MTDEEIAALLERPESDRLERKASLSGERVKNEIAQAICAFSNDLPNHRQPGVIIIGLRDDGSCAGTAIDDELLRTLAGMKDEGSILPFPSLVVQKRTLSGCDIAVVTVQPSSAPPVRYRDRAWIRVGPRKDVATPDEERQLSEKRRFNLLPFDQRPVETATLDDLDLELFESTNAPTRLNWFSDRIEIVNPGGPFGQSTIENFGRPGITDYRNPHIAEALHTLGFVQRFGVGIAIARKQLLDNGNPPLEFEVERSHVLALVRSSR